MADLKRRDALGNLQPAPASETLGGFLGVRTSRSRIELEGGGWLGRYRQRVRPKTFANAVEVLPNLLPLLSVEVGQLRPREVEDQIYRVAERAPRQAQVTLQLLKTALRNARERGHIVNDAVLAIRPPAFERRERFFLEWEDVEKLAAAAHPAVPEPHPLRGAHRPPRRRVLRAPRRRRRPRPRDRPRRARRLQGRPGAAQDESEPQASRSLPARRARPPRAAPRADTEPEPPRLPEPPGRRRRTRTTSVAASSSPPAARPACRTASTSTISATPTRR